LFDRVPRDGRLKLEVPSGTALELDTFSADVELEGALGEVRVHSLSGSIRVRGCTSANLESVSGDLEVEGCSGPLRVHTVSGDARIEQAGPGQLDYESTSGDLDWSGECGRGCRLEAQSISGNVRLALSAQSGFVLSFSSRSGDLRDSFGAALTRKRHRAEGKAGSGEGRIECDTLSGDLTLTRQ
jgi:DUF4097 and DUF4098 domain-containing protein YvlB